MENIAFEGCARNLWISPVIMLSFIFKRKWLSCPRKENMNNSLNTQANVLLHDYYTFMYIWGVSGAGEGIK